MVHTSATRILDIAGRVLLALGAAAVVVMMLHIVTNAAMRAFADAPLTGTNEYVTYWYMPVVAMLGFVVAQREWGHTEATVVHDRLPRRNRFELRIAGLVLVGVVCAGFAWFGWLEALHNRELELTGGVIGVVVWPVTFLVPVTYTVLTVHVLTEVALLLTRPSRFEADDGADDAAEDDEIGRGGGEGHAVG
ncbi:TRAP transporter small permease [Prauserella halophila]|uniref:TRAP transporter small permease n=1 Tax=Prauserella halophila TaxID=185641 RepID=UPI0020A2D859|nr:TRAP transporter small permease [Prauserella halophila]MCP2237116.1 TRAP-type C4-dicarboxylate transport system, small permease component [Prauserella halophila]